MICYYLTQKRDSIAPKKHHVCVPVLISTAQFYFQIIVPDSCVLWSFSLKMMSFVSLHSHVSAMCPDIFLQLVFFRICIYICILYSIFTITFLLCLPTCPTQVPRYFVFRIFSYFCLFLFSSYTFSTVAPSRTCLPPQVPRLTEFEKSSRGHSAPAPCPALLIIALTQIQICTIIICKYINTSKLWHPGPRLTCNFAFCFL